MIQIENVVVLGANGAMGTGGAEVFAAGGCEVTLLARSEEKAREGLTGVQGMAKSARIADRISVGTYDRDLEKAVSGADLVFEAVAEDAGLKNSFFERVDRARRSDSLVATVSSGLSITSMAEPRSESFRKHFLGIHLFNPPNVIVGTEVIPHAGTDARLVPPLVDLLEQRFGRIVTLCDDKPAFAGNRIGFKVLNEVARHAARHGVAFMDYLIGPQTGRAMPPLATIDLVGWDVHRAIVDNVYANTHDEAHDVFELPAYMARLIDAGHLGNKTPAAGGFYQRRKEGPKKVTLELDPVTGNYDDADDGKVDPIPFVERMRDLNRVGCYAQALQHFVGAEGPEADLAREIILGYVSYALNRVGEEEVVRTPRYVDRIMGFGFNWAPPSVIVDLLGVRETIRALERCGLEVPKVLADAKPGERLYREPNVDVGRFFSG